MTVQSGHSKLKRDTPTPYLVESQQRQKEIGFMKIEEDLAYEQWKRENSLDRRGFPHAPVLPSQSVAARIENNSAKAADSERDDD